MLYLAAGISEAIGIMNFPGGFARQKREAGERAANIWLTLAALLAGTAMVLNDSLDMMEVLLLGSPLAAFIYITGLLLKWFVLSPKEITGNCMSCTSIRRAPSSLSW